jgi:flagellar protein FlaG
MITDVTSKVDLPTSASRRDQTGAPPKNEHVVGNVGSSNLILVSPPNRVSVERAVDRVREILERSDSHLQIEVDPDLQRVIVKVLDGDSGEVIRQIPPQEVIELAKNLSVPKGLLFEEHV